MHNTIKCHDLVKFCAVISELQSCGLAFTGNAENFTITITGY